MLTSNLMCFGDGCLYQGQKEFGCFDVAIPVEKKPILVIS